MSKPRQFYTIKNTAPDTLEIDIEGIIGGYEIDWNTWEIKKGPNKADVKKLLKDVGNSQASTIIVNINSYGGDVNDGVSIHDMLAEHKAKVITRVTGHTASAATVIAQAGDERQMSANALYLIHRASTIGYGNVNQLKQCVSDLEKVDNTLVSIYAKRSGNSQQEVIDLMDRFDGTGEWLTADEALEAGLIDQINEPMKAVAMVEPKALNMLGLPAIPQNKLNHTVMTNDNDKKSLFGLFREFMAKFAPDVKVNDEAADPAPAEDPKPEPTPAPEPAPAPDPEPEPGESATEEESTTSDTKDAMKTMLAQLKKRIDDLEASQAEKDTKINNLQAIVDKGKALPTETEPKADPTLDDQVNDKNLAAANKNAQNLKED